MEAPYREVYARSGEITCMASTLDYSATETVILPFSDINLLDLKLLEGPGSDTIIWAATWQNQQTGMCAQQRLRSAWASPQSDQSQLSTWRKLGSLANHWAPSKDSDQNGWMPRLIWVFAGCTVILLVLSCCGSFYFYDLYFLIDIR